MAIICIAVYSTEENGRATYTKQTLMSLLNTVDFHKHRLFVSDNGSCESLQTFYTDFSWLFEEKFPKQNLTIRKNGRNLGTSGAVNLGIRTREKGQHVIKMDDDVVVHQSGWVEEMEEVLAIEPKIGLACLKRDDFGEKPDHENELYRTKLIMLPHEKHGKWYPVEQLVNRVVNGQKQYATAMGTCQMIRSELLDKVKFYYQIPPYGWDDLDLGVRCALAGYATIFLSYIRISHLDTGVTEGGIKTEFIEWKQKRAGEVGSAISERIKGYVEGKIPLAYEPTFDEN